MSRSWGHAIVRLTDAERARLAKQNQESLARYGGRYSFGCTVSKCKEPTGFYVRWSYVTGRAGRVTDTIRARCQKHAEAFAKKYSLDLADAPEIDRPLRGGSWGAIERREITFS